MLSVIIPFFNEIDCIDNLLARAQKTLKGAGIEKFELLVVDNGSTQQQSLELRKRCADPSVRVLTLSRNFGYQGALWAGLSHAQGDPVVFMDGDGEDPPEVIAQFISKWREGFDVVYGVRASRKASFFMNVFYRVFYRLLARWSDIHIPLDAGEFSLVSGKALKALNQFRDRTRMMRILRAWIGYRQAAVAYHRAARLRGKSRFSFLSAVAFAFDGFVAATDLPVRLSIYSALGCFALGSVGIIYYLVWYFYANVRIPGYASLNITILFLFSTLFACFSVLARYVITLLHEARGRPPYLVSGDSREEPPG